MHVLKIRCNSCLFLCWLTHINSAGVMLLKVLVVSSSEWFLFSIFSDFSLICCTVYDLHGCHLFVFKMQLICWHQFLQKTVVYFFYWFSWVWFYDISSIAGYLKLNLLYTYIDDKWFVNKVKQFQVLLWITNNSIKHQSFVYMLGNDQTVLFQTIQSV